jgi:beta-phosphoglucomutase
MPRAIFCDLDGTLVGSEPLHYEALRETLATRGVDLDRETYFRRYLSLTDRATFVRVIEDFRREDLRVDLDALVARKEAIFAESGSAGPPLLPGAAAFVAEAARRGPLALVTGATRDEAHRALERHALAASFATIVTADDVGRGKPDPEPYRTAFERLRRERLLDLRPGECLAVEDSPLGLESARAAGLRALALTTSRPATDLGRADLVIGTLADADWAAIESIFG